MTERKKLITIIGITLAVYLCFKYLLSYVIPFFLAYMIVHLMNPLTEKVKGKLSWKKEVVISVLLTICMLVSGILLYCFYHLLMEQIRRIALNFDLYYQCFCGWINSCCCMIHDNFGMEVGEVENFVYSSMDHAVSQMRIYLIPNVFNYSFRYLKKVLDAGMFLLILFISVILLMKDYDEIREKLLRYELYRHWHNISGRIWKKGGLYLKAQGTIIIVEILLCTIGFWIMRNPYFLVLGIGVGLTDALPFIGTGTFLIPISVIILVKKQYFRACGYLLLFLVTYFTREFLEPRLIGEKLGVYPIVMVAVVYAGIYLYGAAGVILGPVTLILVQEILKEI